MTATTTTPTAVKISGQAELQYSKRETIDVPGREGHLLALGEVRGTNQNTSASDFFADVPAINVETADLMQGNGTHQGYYTMRKGDDAVTAEWHGTVTTVPGPNQQPQTSFNGTWEYIQGTGRYSGIEGSGIYAASFCARPLPRPLGGGVAPISVESHRKSTNCLCLLRSRLDCGRCSELCPVLVSGAGLPARMEVKRIGIPSNALPLVPGPLRSPAAAVKATRFWMNRRIGLHRRSH